jgi:hypothetical protein
MIDVFDGLLIGANVAVFSYLARELRRALTPMRPAVRTMPTSLANLHQFPAPAQLAPTSPMTMHPEPDEVADLANGEVLANAA